MKIILEISKLIPKSNNEVLINTFNPEKIEKIYNVWKSFSDLDCSYESIRVYIGILSEVQASKSQNEKLIFVNYNKNIGFMVFDMAMQISDIFKNYIGINSELYQRARKQLIRETMSANTLTTDEIFRIVRISTTSRLLKRIYPMDFELIYMISGVKKTDKEIYKYVNVLIGNKG